MNRYIELLSRLIATPSFSREEGPTADILEDFLLRSGVKKVERLHNNIWAANLHFDPTKPTILLNSHHDTVRPSSAYTRDPYSPDIESGRLYGLGSNDAGASAVSLTAAFLEMYTHSGMSHNIILALTAEEEVSGANGIESLLPTLPPLSFAIVGEPTGMQLAIAERGLVVLDCIARGRTGHAARNEGDNAIYHAIRDIEWLRTHRFERESELFGSVGVNVTIISAGTQHNVIPAECRFTVDVRVTDRYTLEEVIDEIRSGISSEATPRSVRLRPSYISPDHPIVAAGLEMGRTTYGSPTSSDQALLPIPSLKMGPGDSARSHTADEYIEIAEIEQGIKQYIAMLKKVCGSRTK